ncbi:MAG: N-6 DNA methylase, partial [Chloroflexales bacterium]|nr:N-6 DNA methylase [Chloroflexales bacterium]
MPYTTIVTEGGLLPADILDAIAAGELEGQRPEDFGLERTRNLSDRISAAWQAARGQWALFQSYLADLPAGETATTETREQWVLPLLRVLGYQLARNRSAYVVQGRTFAISHCASEGDDAPPIHIESVRNSLDARPPSGRPRLSPHALVQEYLNSTEQLWGIVTNGERLRLLRDSSRFTRPAYVEFDLRSMLEGEIFSEFALLYRLLHRSRLPVGADEAAACLLEKYHQRAVEAGGRVREGLRDGVESALKLLGYGLLRHPANAELRARLARGLETGSDGDGSLTPLGYYRQLLRLVYRMLFLMVAEERGLIATAHDEDEGDILSPAAYRPAPDRRLAIYREHYSVGRLRRLAETSGAGRGPYTDLWDGLLTTFRLLEGSDELAPRRLGLAPLDGDLFGDGACAALTTNTRLTNRELLAAVRALSLYHEKASKTLRRVNYGALDVEELGSVYESLLDYRPVVTEDRTQMLQIGQIGTDREAQELASDPCASAKSALSAFYRFDLVSGTERKTTGSYYTRPELVQELIKSALVPVLEERLKAAGPDPKAREEAILALRVVDPACGSGAFLLAAARRLGRELARVRAGEDQPSPTQFRRAVRDVIRRCIFGVDLNPLAVDLCKLALWLEGHAAGLPLSFLDHHIRHGNSLVGATRALVEQGIPDDAYKAVTGDDKATASSVRTRNKQERELHQKQGMVQHDLFAAEASAGDDLAAALRALDAAADDSVAAVRARAARYAALRRQAQPERAKFDLWTAAFFQPLTPSNARYAPTSKDLIDFNPTGEKALMAAPLAESVGFFHWELEFPQVFHHKDTEVTKAGQLGSDLGALRAFVVSSGFDVVLGNPPWERIKLQEQEHFVDVPEIAGAANKAARDKAIAAWRQGDERQRARIALFDAAKYRAEAESRFVRASERFPLTAVGDVNTYALFAEHCRILLSPTGRAGIIVPTGIVTDDTTKDFFGDLVEKQSLVQVLGFENEAFIFPAVHHSFRFCGMILNGASHRNINADFVFFCRHFEHLTHVERHFNLTRGDIALISPNTRTCPIFRTAADAELTKKLYRQVPVLQDERNGVNPWGVRFLAMLHMANDSHLFRDASGEGLVPLYEAKLLHQFTHRWATYDNDEVRLATVEELINPQLALSPRYWVKADEVDIRFQEKKWCRRWVLGWRDICRSHDERTAIACVFPRSASGDTFLLMLPAKDEATLASCLLTNLNSFVFDFSARQKVAGIHLKYFTMRQLPVLPPDRFTPADIAFIVPRVVELVYTAWDIRAFAEDVWAEGDEALRAELLRRNAECNAGAPGELFSPRDGFPMCYDGLGQIALGNPLQTRAVEGPNDEYQAHRPPSEPSRAPF